MANLSAADILSWRCRCYGDVICAHTTTRGLFAGIGLRHVAARSVGMGSLQDAREFIEQSREVRYLPLGHSCSQTALQADQLRQEAIDQSRASLRQPTSRLGIREQHRPNPGLRCFDAGGLGADMHGSQPVSLSQVAEPDGPQLTNCGQCRGSR
jgi:hypothetical protein